MVSIHTEQVMNYIEQCKECDHVSERLFFEIIKMNKMFKNGKSRCLFIDRNNINNVNDMLSSNHNITHIFIDIDMIDSNIVKKVVSKLPSNIDFLNIGNCLYDMEDISKEQRQKKFKKLSKTLIIYHIE